MVPTRWSHSPHGKGFDDSCSTNVSATRSLAFRRCPLAPTLTRFICLRFLSLGLPQIKRVNVMRNFEERLRTCVRQEGRHLSDIIFRNWIINVSNQNCIYCRLFWCWHNFFILKIKKLQLFEKNMRSFCATLYILYIFMWHTSSLWGTRWGRRNSWT